MRIKEHITGNSANIIKIRAISLDLFIYFKSGDVWKYEDGAEKFEEMKKAESVGKYFHANIIGKYNHTKLDEEAKEVVEAYFVESEGEEDETV